MLPFIFICLLISCVSLAFFYSVSRMLAPLVFPQVADYGSQIMDDESEATAKEINAVVSIYGDFSSEALEEYHSDWIEPALQLYASESSKNRERQQVLDALRLFRTNESLQVYAWPLLLSKGFMFETVTFHLL